MGNKGENAKLFQYKWTREHVFPPPYWEAHFVGGTMNILLLYLSYVEPAILKKSMKKQVYRNVGLFEPEVINRTWRYGIGFVHDVERKTAVVSSQP